MLKLTSIIAELRERRDEFESEAAKYSRSASFLERDGSNHASAISHLKQLAKSYQDAADAYARAAHILEKETGKHPVVVASMERKHYEPKPPNPSTIPLATSLENLGGDAFPTTGLVELHTVEQFRDAMGWSFRQMGDACGVGPNTISRHCQTTGTTLRKEQMSRIKSVARKNGYLLKLRE